MADNVLNNDLQKLPPISGLELLNKLESGVELMTGAGPLRVDCHAPGNFRLHLGSNPGPDYGIIKTSPNVDHCEVECAEGNVKLISQGYSLELWGDPLNFTLRKGDKPLMKSADDGHFVRRFRLPPFAKLSDGWVASFALQSGEPLYGLGEKTGLLNKRGQLIESWNHDALGNNAEISYKNCPFAWSPQGWGVFVHTPARVVHSVGSLPSIRSYVIQVEDTVLDLFLFAADSPEQMLERYTDLTGRGPVPPQWSFGVWLSKAYYQDVDEARDIYRQVRDREMPCDVFTLDGRAWLDTDTRFAFEWDASRYPRPTDFTGPLHDSNFRLCVWEYPLVSVNHPLFDELAQKGWLLKDRDGKAYEYEWDLSPFGKVLTPLPKSGLLDFTHPEAYAFWGRMHKKLFESGIDIIKSDFGEQVPDDAVAHNGDTGRRLHNVYPMLYNRCVYEASREYFGDDAIVWGRSGWSGSQCYPIQWGGDPEVSWEGLAGSIRGGLSWGMSGSPYYSHDIGGFYGGQPDPELYVRWLQAGVLGSHCRIHGIGPREPWYFGEEAEAISKQWLEFRYQLIPYLYACAQDAAASGLPIMRAMPLAFPHDHPAWPFDEQYMLGPSLLVAPIIQPGGQKSVYLPQGTWFDYWSGEEIQGGRMIDCQMPLERIPVFGREGCILPLGPVVRHSGELKDQPGVQGLKLFGLPSAQAGLTGLAQVAAGDDGVEINGLPTGISLETMGGVRAEYQDGIIRCGP
jgi:alpha-D-xyloside xylohydrolase